MGFEFEVRDISECGLSSLGVETKVYMYMYLAVALPCGSITLR